MYWKLLNYIAIRIMIKEMKGNVGNMLSSSCLELGRNSKAAESDNTCLENLRSGVMEGRQDLGEHMCET